jgi:stearoyl-CoA desaturase (delta-9 desaturase)
MNSQQSLTIDNDFLKSRYQLHSVPIVLVPFLGFIAAVGLSFYSSLTLAEGLLYLICFCLTMIGVEVGFHRYFAHHTFKTNTNLRVILAILGMTASQGRLIYWVANHRRHHQFSDEPRDIHSPYFKNEQSLQGLRGLWHAHIEWIFTHKLTNVTLMAKDLLKDPLIFKINQLYLVWILFGLIVPAVIDGLLVVSWMGVLKGFLWGGLVRIFLVQQFTFSINSICHQYGDRPFFSTDYSTNNLWLAIPTFGQSWHNNHHAFPNSAIMGLYWWQIDLGTWFLRTMEFLGWVWEIKKPSEKLIEAKKTA